MLCNCPYPGLRPFRSDEDHIFFGREEQTDDLLRRLKDGHFLAIVGSSGCGKSSLVKAGLIAALETGLMGSEGPLWLCVQMQPGMHPMRRLAEALVQNKALVQSAERTRLDVDGGMALGLLLAQLRRGPLGLVEALRLSPQALAPAGSAGKAALASTLNGMSEAGLRNDQAGAGEMVSAPRQNLLVLVDQFEEIFRLYQESDTDEALAFVALLLQTACEAERQQLPIYVVITMRSDFIGDCALFDGLPEALNRSQYLTPRLHREQLRQAIVGPAKVFGGDVQPELVSLLLNEIGDDQDQLPLLQHLLMRMWTWRGRSSSGAKKVLMLEDYRAVGGLEDALSRHADEAYERLNPLGKRITEDQRIAEVMFRQISKLGEDGRAIRRPTEAGRIADLAGTTLAAVEAVVNVFRDPEVSFLMPPLPEAVEPNTKLDISHESLIRQWDRLRQWARDEADKAQRYREIVADATKYEDGKGNLWYGHELNQALQWKDKQKPNATWAQVYGTEDEFRRFENFLNKSEEAEQAKLAELARREAAEQAELARQEAAEQAELARREADRKRTLRVWQVAAVTCAFFFVFALLAAGWAITAKRAIAEQKAKVIAASANLETARGDRRVAILALLEVLPDPDASANPLNRAWRWLTLNDPPIVDEAVRALGQASYFPVGHVVENADQTSPLIFASFPANDFLAVFTEQSAHRLEPGGEGRPQEIRFDDPDSTSGSSDGRAFESTSVSPDGRYLLTTARGQAKIWTLQTDAKAEKFGDWDVDKNEGRTVGAFGPHGKIATVSFLGGVKIWSWAVDTKKTPEQLPVEVTVPEQERDESEKDGLRINSIAFDRAGKRLVTTSWAGITRIWDADTGSPLDKLKTGSPGWQARFSPDGQQVVAVSANGASLWKLVSNEGKLVQWLVGGGKQIRTAEFSADGTRIVTSSLDGIAAVWDASDGRLLRVFQGPYQPGARRSAAVFSPDGRQIAAVFSTSRVFVWNVEQSDGTSGLCQLPLRLPTKPQSLFSATTTFSATATALDLSRKGHLVTAFDRSVSVWDCAGRPRDLPPFQDPVMDIAFNPADTSLMTAAGHEVLILNIDTEEVIDRLQGHSAAVLTVAHDRQGNRIATGSQDKTARIWETQSRQELLILEHDAAVISVGLSPDGERLVTVDAKYSIRIWNAGNGNLLHETKIEEYPIHVQFNGNDQVLITSAGPQVRAADEIPRPAFPAAEPQSPTPRFPPYHYHRWEWNLSDSDPPKPMDPPKAMKGDVWLRTAAYNILVNENGAVHLTTPDVVSAKEREGFFEGELGLPTVGSPIKFVTLEFESNRLATLSTDGTVQVAALLPVDWAEVWRDAKKTVETWDEHLRQLSPLERKRLGLETP